LSKLEIPGQLNPWLNLVGKVNAEKIELMPNTASMWVKGKQLTVEEEETARLQVFI
jgi:uncharacterized protein YlzI (FlbEa/FlbD family)